jgi:hypothetical protein
MKNTRLALLTAGILCFMADEQLAQCTGCWHTAELFFMRHSQPIKRAIPIGVTQQLLDNSLLTFQLLEGVGWALFDQLRWKEFLKCHKTL